METATLPLAKRVHLLLLLLWAPTERGIVGESVQGVVRIMKLLFLMKMDAGLDKYVTDYYTFAPYKLGPFEKTVYDDLDALVERNIIERTTVEESQLSPESRLPNELESEQGIDFDRAETNVIYKLTAAGKKYAQAYAKGTEQIDAAILTAIKDIKSTWVSRPLIDLLRYVYKKYPKYTSESEIRDKVLGSNR
jgi:predicted P-loop ATPase